ncbi:MAG: NUDIX domain-containing protein [Anaerolineae bacterium]
MRMEDQGIERARYIVVPRTLTFLTHGEDVLLLRGAAAKPRFAGCWNGVGGHVEPGEDLREAALREVREEAGLVPAELTLRALLHVTGQTLAAGVLVFVFVGEAPSREVTAPAEGALSWYPWRALPAEVVEDLPEMLAQVLSRPANGIAHGLYLAQEDGTLARSWQPGQAQGTQSASKV